MLAGINAQRQDNYNVFLPFYPFTVKKLNLNSGELDSVIKKRIRSPTDPRPARPLDETTASC